MMSKIAIKLALALSVTTLLTGFDLKAITFEDENLENVIRRVTRVRSGPIPQEKLDKIEVLNASNKEIQSVNGIEHLKNLIELNLSLNNISDLDAIGYLEKIDILNISGNPVSDLSPIEYCASLREISAINCKIKDLSPILNMHSIYKIILHNNPDLEFGPESKQRELHQMITNKGVFIEMDDDQYKELTSEAQTQEYEEGIILEEDINFEAALYYRNWTSSDDRKIQATLIWIDSSNNIYLETKEDVIYKVPANRMSERDKKLCEFWKARGYYRQSAKSLKNLVDKYSRDVLKDLGRTEITLRDLVVNEVKARGSSGIIFLGDTLGDPAIRIEIKSSNSKGWGGSEESQLGDVIKFREEGNTLYLDVLSQGSTSTTQIISVPEQVTVSGYLGNVLSDRLILQHARRN